MLATARIPTLVKAALPAAVALAAASPAQAAVAPSVAVDPHGTAHLSWLRVHGGKDLVQGRSRADDGTLSDADYVSPAGAGALAPAVASGAPGVALHAWLADHGDGSRIRLRRRSGDGSLGPVQVISEPGAVSRPEVAVAPTGAAVVAWARFTGGKRVVEMRRRSATGTLGPVKRVSSSQPSFSVEQLDMAIDAAGNAVIAWQVNAVAPFVQARRVDADGTLTPVQNITSGAPAVEPAVGVDAGGDALIAFRRLREGNYVIQVRRRSAAGTLAPIRDVSNPAAAAFSLQLAVAGTGGAVVAWRTHFSGGGIKAARITPGGTVGTVVDVTPTGTYLMSFKLGIDADGDAGLAWRAWSGADTGYVQFRAFSAAGSLSGTQDLSVPDAAAGRLDAGFEPGGGALVVWEDADTQQIVGRRRTAAGELGQIHTLSY